MTRPKRNNPEVTLLAKNLCRIMMRKKISGYKLSKILNEQGAGEYTCSEGLISLMKDGKTEIAKWIPRLAKALDCEIMEFYK